MNYFLVRLLYGTSIFIGAFLLFQIQPIVGRHVLPLFGGAPAVWNICLLFFQVVLLGGYGTAHLLFQQRSPKAQAGFYLVLLCCSAILVVFLFRSPWSLPDESSPQLQILLALLSHIGLPYLLLATVSPLMQAWYAQETGQAIPYRYYALSNAASLLALLSYPFLVEPSFRLVLQDQIWQGLYLLFCLVIAVVALRIFNLQVAPQAERAKGDSAIAELDWGKRFTILGFAACGSMLLLAVTNHVCSDVASVPFLWIVPLSLYLLSFILCFESNRWYVRRLFVVLTLLGVLTLGAHGLMGFSTSLPAVLFFSFSYLFLCCMTCHGEIARLRPQAQRETTLFYFLLSAGGAFGGLFVGLVAPLLFRSYYELILSSILLGLLLLKVTAGEQASFFPVLQSAWVRRMAFAVYLTAILLSYPLQFLRDRDVTLAQERNFFGVLRVTESTDAQSQLVSRMLAHGRTLHGLQFVNEERANWATGYYCRSSGLGIALQQLEHRQARKIAAIGLGVGTLAALTRAGDFIRFYEIDPAVLSLAQKYFSFLKNSAAQLEIAIGDARLSLEKETPQQFDLLLVDAFSGDSVPVHLLTREAFALYLEHLSNDGILVVHISNRYLDLRDIVWKLAEHFSLDGYFVRTITEEGRGNQCHSDYFLLTKQKNQLVLSKQPGVAWTSMPKPVNATLWTDDFNSPFAIFDWQKNSH